MNEERKIKDNIKNNWVSILPEKQNDYKGFNASLVFLVIIGCIYVFRSIVHTFAPDGGAEIIAGFELETMGSVDMVLWAWAWSGVYQILLSCIIWAVLIRYRRFIPAIYLILIIENILLRIVGIFKPLTETLPTHTPPGAIGYSLMFPVVLIFFVLSIRVPPKKQKKEQNVSNGEK